MNTPHTHVYCDLCKAIRPWRFPTCMGTMSAVATPKRATCFVAYAATTLRRSMSPSARRLQRRRYSVEQHRGRTFVFELDEDWLPTPESINALPEPLRQYIHQL